MAFFSKFGNILKQAATKQLNGQTQSSLSSPSIFQAIRYMSSSKLFVGGISYSTDEQSLREAFSKYGEVVESRVIVDRETGRSRGFGFITYTSTEEASSAIQALDGQDLHGRRIKVNYAIDRSGGFRSSGFGGNYGPPAGGYWGGAGGYGGNPGGYGGGAGGYGGGGGAGGYGDTSDNYVQGGGGGYSQHGGDFGGDSQFGGSTGQLGSDFGGNNQFGGSSGQFGSESGGNNQFSGSTGQLGSDFGGSNQFGGSSGQFGSDFGGNSQFGGSSGQFGSESGGNNQFDVSGSGQFSSQFGGSGQFGGDDQIESTEYNMNKDNGDWKDNENDASDDTNVAKRA